MVEGWDEDAKKRPSFEKIVEKIISNGNEEDKLENEEEQNQFVPTNLLSRDFLVSSSNFTQSSSSLVDDGFDLNLVHRESSSSTICKVITVNQQIWVN